MSEKDKQAVLFSCVLTGKLSSWECTQVLDLCVCPGKLVCGPWGASGSDHLAVSQTIPGLDLGADVDQDLYSVLMGHLELVCCELLMLYLSYS